MQSLLKRRLSSLRKVLETGYREFQLGKGKPALFHSPFYSASPNEKYPTIVTVYDLIPEKLKAELPHLDQFRELKRKSIENASWFIVISEQTKSDLVDLFQVDPSRVGVAYLGVDSSFFSQPSDSFLMDELKQNSWVGHPYLLYVGGREDHKNFPRFLEAYAQSEVNKKYGLQLVGYDYSEKEKELIHRLQIGDRVKLHVKASESELRCYYQQAKLFVYPSLYEGFGLPPLEAMASGCPVAAANAGSIPEVVGSAAELFDPRSITSIAGAVERALDTHRSAELVALGTSRVHDFTWDQCADKHAEIYQRAAKALL